MAVQQINFSGVTGTLRDDAQEFLEEVFYISLSSWEKELVALPINLSWIVQFLI